MMASTKMPSVQPLPLACPDCAAQMPETAAFCPGCGRSMTSAGRIPGRSGDFASAQEQERPRAQGRVGALPENVAGAIAYVTCVPAIVWLLVEPYNRNRFVRFHSLQSLVLWAAGILVWIALRLSGLVLFRVPMLGPLLIALLWGMVVLAVVLVWLVLLVKALQGEMFELPLLGRFADWYAGPRSEE